MVWLFTTVPVTLISPRLFVVRGRQHDARLLQRRRAVDGGVTAGREEPQTIAHDRTAERALIGSRQLVGMLVGDVQTTMAGSAHSSNGVSVVHDGFRKLMRPLPGEAVAAALRDRVDHAAGEPAVLRRDAGCQDLRLLDRVLDEEILRLREQVVVDVDAVDHEHVVEREGAVDDQLVGVR